VPRLLSVYEGLITNWEGMKKDSAYSSVHSALGTGIALLSKYYDATDESPLAVLSTVLDPATKDSYIKHYFAPQYQAIAIHNIRNLYRGTYLAKSATLDARTEESPREPTVSFTPTEIFGLSRRLAATQAHRAQEVQSDDPCAELDFWMDKGSRYPVLRIMAHDILAVPASSVPCERAFSGAKHTDTDNRNRLLPEHLGAIQIAKADMLRWRDVKKEEKKTLEREKLEQWREHESKTIADQAEKLGIIHTI